MAKQLKKTRQAVSQRLRRKGIVESVKGLSTEYLNQLWDEYKNSPPLIENSPLPEPTNYEQFRNMLHTLIEDFTEVFIGTVWDAWRHLEDLKYVHTRVDIEKMNSDENFIIQEIRIVAMAPSGWEVDGDRNKGPEDVYEYVLKIYDKYIT